jgi:HEAT repeat protein
MSSYNEAELFKFLHDQNIILRTAAARRLHLLGTRNSFDYALTLSISHRFEEREVAAYLLGQLGTPEYAFSSESIEPLFTLMCDKYFEVRATSVIALGFIAMRLKHLPKRILEKMISLSRDPEPSVRWAVAFALGYIRQPSALACLKEMGDDTDSKVRESVDSAVQLHIDHI